MIHAVGRGDRSEMALIESEIRERTALSTNEQLSFAGLYTKEDFESFLKEERQADLICADITIFQGVRQAELLREKYARAAMILIADMTISPVTYMKPAILAAALLLKPLQKSVVEQVMKEIFHRFLEQTQEEEVFVLETREEKQRIPYSQILYFEARSKKIYVCTKNYEYGFYDTMEHLEEQYSEQFIRCHRSFLVNRRMMEQARLSGNYLTFHGGIEIPVSRSYKSQIKEFYS